MNTARQMSDKQQAQVDNARRRSMSRNAGPSGTPYINALLTDKDPGSRSPIDTMMHEAQRSERKMQEFKQPVSVHRDFSYRLKNSRTNDQDMIDPPRENVSFVQQSMYHKPLKHADVPNLCAKPQRNTSNSPYKKNGIQTYHTRRAEPPSVTRLEAKKDSYRHLKDDKHHLLEMPKEDPCSSHTTASLTPISEKSFYGKRSTPSSTSPSWVAGGSYQNNSNRPSMRHVKRRQVTGFKPSPRMVEEKPKEEQIHVILSDHEDSEKDDSDMDDIETSQDDFYLLSNSSTRIRRSTRLNDIPDPTAQVPKLLKKLKCTWKSAFRAGTSVSICAHDVSAVEEGEFLNDTVIDFYINYLLDELVRKDEAENCMSSEDIFIFSTFFYKKLTSPSTNYLKLDKWTKNVDIFSKKYLFIPVCQHSHWSLALVCNKQCFSVDNTIADIESSIIHIDSLYSGHSTGYITKTLRKYLSHEWQRNVENVHSICNKVAVESPLYRNTNGHRSFDFNNTLGGKISCPKQNNYCDCGLFLLKFLESFLLKYPPQSLDIKKDMNRRFTVTSSSSKREDKVFDTKNWYQVQDVMELRQSIRLQLVRMIAEQNPESDRAKRVLNIVMTERKEQRNRDLSNTVDNIVSKRIDETSGRPKKRSLNSVKEVPQTLLQTTPSPMTRITQPQEEEEEEILPQNEVLQSREDDDDHDDENRQAAKSMSRKFLTNSSNRDAIARKARKMRNEANAVLEV